MVRPIHCLSRGVIVNDGFLLVCSNPRSKKPYVYLPGGHIEEGESAETALERELKEETSLTFKVGSFLGVLESSFNPTHGEKKCHRHEYNFCFLASSPSLTTHTLPPEAEPESVQFKWVPLGHLSCELLLPRALATQIPLWLNNKSDPHVFFSDMELLF